MRERLKNHKISEILAQICLYYKQHKKTALFAAVFLMLPLLTGLGVGYEMKAGRMANIPLAVLDQDESEFSRTIISYVLESDTLALYDYASSSEEMEEWFNRGQVLAGMIIPQGLATDMVQGNAPQVLLIYDGSSLMVAGAAKSAMSEVLLTLQGAYLKSFYEGKLSVVPEQALRNALPIDVTYRALYNPAKNFRNYILPGMLVALLQVELAVLGVERSRRGKQNILSLLLKCLKLGALGAVLIILCLVMQYLWFDLPYRGSLAAGIILTLLYAVCITGFGVILGQIIPDRTFASQAAAFLVLPTSILGGYTFPLLAMPAFFQQLSKVLPFTYYGEAIRGLCLKGLDFSHVLPDMGAMALFLACGVPLLAGAVCLRKIYEKYTKNHFVFRI